MDLELIGEQVKEGATILLTLADLEPGQILLVGCSTSEVIGEKIGSSSNVEVAEKIVASLLEITIPRGIYLAIQCCEHLNRALVVEKEAARLHNLDLVEVYPIPKAGGALAGIAMDMFTQPVVVESVKADAGMDIGDTFIGMHLKSVVVPVRSAVTKVGKAHLTMALTRPKLIGGPRAVYCKE